MLLDRHPDLDRDQLKGVGITILVHAMLLAMAWHAPSDAGRNPAGTATGDQGLLTVNFVPILRARTEPIPNASANEADASVATIVPDTPGPIVSEASDLAAATAQSRALTASTATRAETLRSATKPDMAATPAGAPSSSQHDAGSPNDDNLEAAYAAAVRHAIVTIWAKSGQRTPGNCALTLLQEPGGKVISAFSQNCTLTSEARNALEAAALMAQPLPYAGYERVFRNTLTIDVSGE